VGGIFVNIFGGIMRCDTIGKGIVNAVENLECKVPIVVRLEGTNANIGLEIISNSKINAILAEDMDDGAMKIVSLVGNKEAAHEHLGR
jgi:succinyl-CoA synthetase beta subunit